MPPPKIMGILNVTPDSFSDGGRLASSEAAVERGLALIAEGADIIDVGGESTRPGAEPVPEDEELRRVIPVVRGLARAGIAVSIDTMKAEVMRRAEGEGAIMLNDVSALQFDPESLNVAAAGRARIVLMHMIGDPRTMQHAPAYDDVLQTVLDHLRARINVCVAAGIARERLIADPGIGFGKTLAHNAALMRGLERFHTLGIELLLGASRKSVIPAIVGAVPPLRRLPGSIALAIRGMQAGVHWVRVHDVAETRQALLVWDAIAAAGARRLPAATDAI